MVVSGWFRVPKRHADRLIREMANSLTHARFTVTPECYSRGYMVINMEHIHTMEAWKLRDELFDPEASRLYILI
jgi:hypothetical protein